jgi:hypothetical protein
MKIKKASANALDKHRTGLFSITGGSGSSIRTEPAPAKGVMAVGYRPGAPMTTFYAVRYRGVEAAGAAL